MPQYAALSALADKPGLSNSVLARRCFVTRQTMNEVLSGLQRAGLIDRAAHPSDGRVQQTELTATARDVVTRADRAVADVEEQMTSGLDQIECAELMRLLSACAGSLEATEAHQGH